MLLLIAALILGAMVAFNFNATPGVITAFFALALLLGLTMTLPISLPSVGSMRKIESDREVSTKTAPESSAAETAAGSAVRPKRLIVCELGSRTASSCVTVFTP